MATLRKPRLRWDWGQQKLLEIFGADLRSLAALRIVLALTVLFDLASRATNLAVHYSDGGILPRRVQAEKIDPWLVSLNFMNGTAELQWALFSVAALAAVAMLVGYRTRLMCILVWVLVMSIQWRNYLVGYSADELLRLLLFWSMFLPLGACWSVDRLRGAVPEPPSTRVLSMATAGLFLQIAFVYWFTAFLKSGAEWRVDGTALYYALSAKQLGTPIGAYLLQFPDLLKVLTFGTLALEIVAPLLLFSPFFTVPARIAGIIGVVGLHIGISMTLAVGYFPWIGAACMVCFLPGWFWDRLIPQLRLDRRRLFSGVRPAWQAVASIGHPSWAAPWTRPLSPAGVGRLSIAELPLGNSGYGASARAGRLGTGEAVPASEHLGVHPSRRASLVVNLFATACLIFVLGWNLSTISVAAVPGVVRPIGFFLGLPQYWGMFAPYPVKSTMWFIAPGTLQDGRQVDLLPSVIEDNPRLLAEVNWGEPSDVRATFNGEERWRKVFESIANSGDSDVLLSLGQYTCRNWNGTNAGTPSQLMTFDIMELWEPTLEDNQRGPVQQRVLWSHVC
jgi:Vitamin K-dependent gamma-carboxylase